ncbi:hypothetical protein CYU10_001634 [Lactococcus lactis subsp. lactis]|uniref:Uncharacterized protein n=2 Tax=Lactococcus lactis TaxID=1358 RepID=A0A2R7Y0F4_LACLL|nr:hypothetical protein CYU10_001634 [Lactococcus lactis subsp. lactis]
MQQYLEYCLKGQDTINERKNMLAKKKLELLATLKTVEESIEYIDNKQKFYNDVLNGSIRYKNNLIIESEE